MNDYKDEEFFTDEIIGFPPEKLICPHCNKSINTFPCIETPTMMFHSECYHNWSLLKTIKVLEL